MLSDEEVKERESELKEMEAQISSETEPKEIPAAPESSPEPDASSVPAPEDPTPNSSEPAQEEETKKSEGEKPKDDPMEWAQKKGFKTPEDMARALLQKEREFHAARQTKQNGNGNEHWTPGPQMGYGYPPPPPPPPPVYPSYAPAQQPDSFQSLAAMYPQIDPEDLRRFMPVVIDAAQAIAKRERADLERQISGIQRTTERNNELMSLMQDPAFQDSRVQKEMHEILDADPSIFQRERAPLVKAYEQAMINVARKQLQQGKKADVNTVTMPPVTASGGNGSSYSGPKRINSQEFDRWDVKDQENYLKSNGKILPKAYRR